MSAILNINNRIRLGWSKSRKGIAVHAIITLAGIVFAMTDSRWLIAIAWLLSCVPLGWSGAYLLAPFVEQITGEARPMDGRSLEVVFVILLLYNFLLTSLFASLVVGWMASRRRADQAGELRELGRNRTNGFEDVRNEESSIPPTTSHRISMKRNWVLGCLLLLVGTIGWWWARLERRKEVDVVAPVLGVGEAVDARDMSVDPALAARSDVGSKLDYEGAIELLEKSLPVDRVDPSELNPDLFETAAITGRIFRIPHGSLFRIVDSLREKLPEEVAVFAAGEAQFRGSDGYGSYLVLTTQSESRAIAFARTTSVTRCEAEIGESVGALEAKVNQLVSRHDVEVVYVSTNTLVLLCPAAAVIDRVIDEVSSLCPSHTRANVDRTRSKRGSMIDFIWD